MTDSPTMMEQFVEWKQQTQNCPARQNTHPLYCQYDGALCSFLRCPRRVYLEPATKQASISLQTAEVQIPAKAQTTGKNIEDQIEPT